MGEMMKISDCEWSDGEPINDELPRAIVVTGYMGDANAWCYYDDEYPEEGSCGPYATREEAKSDAEEAGYRVD